MSLVNDMLRDLAHQQQGAAQADRDSEELLADSSLLKTGKRAWLPSLVTFAVVLVVLLSVQKGLLDRFFRSPEHTPALDALLVPESLQVTPTDEAAMTVQEAIAGVDASSKVLNEEDASGSGLQAEEPAPGAIAAIDDARVARRIYELLQKAGIAIAQDRLTSPIEDNAYRYYQEILRLSPENDLAQQGVNAIAQRYIDLAKEAIAQANHERAKVLVERASFVVRDYPAIDVMKQQLMEGAAYPVAAIPVLVEKPDEEQSPPSVAVKTLDVAEAGAGTIEVKRNPEWQDQQAAVQAEQMLTQGKVQAAQLFLQQFIAGHQQPVNATQTLFNLYLQQSDPDAARFLLQQAQGYLPGLTETRMTAQLLLAQGNPAAAISALEGNIQQAEADENYRALLAGLYHKTARYHESASSYRRLLDVFGEKPAYWLGLALALDALQQNASALEAYRRILINGNSLQSQVKVYVEQRIAALSH